MRAAGGDYYRLRCIRCDWLEMRRLGQYLILIVFWCPLVLSDSLTFALAPVISEEILRREGRPIVDYLSEHFIETKQLYYPQRLFMDSVKGNVDLIYIGIYHSAVLHQRDGFAPVLVSNETFDAALVSKEKASIEGLLDGSYQFYASKSDLSVRVIMREKIGAPPNLTLQSNAVNVVGRILKDPKGIGVISVWDLAFLPDNVRSRLHVIKKFKGGPIYVLVNPRIKHLSEQIQRNLLRFHKEWDRTTVGINYLNIVSFRKTNAKDLSHLRDVKRYQAYFQMRNGLH